MDAEGGADGEEAADVWLLITGGGTEGGGEHGLQEREAEGDTGGAEEGATMHVAKDEGLRLNGLGGDVSRRAPAVGSWLGAGN